MGKSKPRKGKDIEDVAPCEAGPATGPRRVLLLRHGQSASQASGEDVPDAPLSELGERQAQAWRGQMGAFGAEVVLVSPLRRAVQTACLAFAEDTAPMELCRFAREKWWQERSNTMRSLADMEDLLKTLPRGSEMLGLEECWTFGDDEPRTEVCCRRQHLRWEMDGVLSPRLLQRLPGAPAAGRGREEQSVQRLRSVLAARGEDVVAVVCHWGVINDLCGASTANAEIIECERAQQSGYLRFPR